MNPTTLDRAAHVVLAGILDAVPKLSADQLDELLLRVSWIHRRRTAGKDVAPEEIDAAVASVGERMHSAAVHLGQPPERVRDTSRLGNRHTTKRNADGVLVCIVCDTPIEWERSGKGGRVPSFCARHKDTRSRQAMANGDGAT